MRKLNKITKSFDTETQGYLNTVAEYEIVGSIKVYENKLVRTRTDYAGYCEKTENRTNCYYTLYIKKEDGSWETMGSGYYCESFMSNDNLFKVHNHILNNAI